MDFETGNGVLYPAGTISHHGSMQAAEAGFLAQDGETYKFMRNQSRFLGGLRLPLTNQVRYNYNKKLLNYSHMLKIIVMSGVRGPLCVYYQILRFFEGIMVLE